MFQNNGAGNFACLKSHMMINDPKGRANQNKPDRAERLTAAITLYIIKPIPLNPIRIKIVLLRYSKLLPPFPVPFL